MNEPSQLTAESVKRAVQLLEAEAGIHPQFSAESVDVARYLTYVVENNESIEEDELEECDKEITALLEELLDDGISPYSVSLVLWAHLRAIEQNLREPSKEEPDRMFA